MDIYEKVVNAKFECDMILTECELQLKLLEDESAGDVIKTNYIAFNLQGRKEATKRILAKLNEL